MAEWTNICKKSKHKQTHDTESWTETWCNFITLSVLVIIFSTILSNIFYNLGTKYNAAAAGNCHLSIPNPQPQSQLHGQAATFYFFCCTAKSDTLKAFSSWLKIMKNVQKSNIEMLEIFREQCNGEREQTLEFPDLTRSWPAECSNRIYMDYENLIQLGGKKYLYIKV